MATESKAWPVTLKQGHKVQGYNDKARHKPWVARPRPRSRPRATRPRPKPRTKSFKDKAKNFGLKAKAKPNIPNSDSPGSRSMAGYLILCHPLVGVVALVK